MCSNNIGISCSYNYNKTMIKEIKTNKTNKKMRELGIFKNSTKLSTDHSKNEILMLHQDDMPSYNSWFLTEYHGVNKVVYRGLSENAPSDLPNFKESLDKLGNPKSIIVTSSTEDTY